MHLVVPQICPEMQGNEMHALYDKYHKVSSFLKDTKTHILALIAVISGLTCKRGERVNSALY